MDKLTQEQLDETFTLIKEINEAMETDKHATLVLCMMRTDPEDDTRQEVQGRIVGSPKCIGATVFENFRHDPGGVNIPLGMSLIQIACKGGKDEPRH